MRRGQRHRAWAAGGLSGDDYVELLPATWRAVSSYGVKISNRVYDCPGLAPFRRQPSGVMRKRNLWEVHRVL